MRTLVTIDWDFFVPERLEWDMGHSETLLFLKMLWHSRYRYRDEMVTDGNERTFWQSAIGKAALDNCKGPVFVSDSHLFAYDVAKKIRAGRVVNIDAHHDCWPVDMTPTGPTIGCHNWLRAYQDLSGCAVQWIAPAHSHVRDDDHKDLHNGGLSWSHSLLAAALLVNSDDEVTIHICRSGCWTPPWLDEQFRQFVKGAHKPVHAMQVRDWHPMKRRWTKQDEANAKRDSETMDAMRKTYATGSIGSSEFVNAKQTLIV